MKKPLNVCDFTPKGNAESYICACEFDFNNIRENINNMKVLRKTLNDFGDSFGLECFEITESHTVHCHGETILHCTLCDSGYVQPIDEIKALLKVYNKLKKLFGQIYKVEIKFEAISCSNVLGNENCISEQSRENFINITI